MATIRKSRRAGNSVLFGSRHEPRSTPTPAGSHPLCLRRDGDGQRDGLAVGIRRGVRSVPAFIDRILGAYQSAAAVGGRPRDALSRGAISMSHPRYVIAHAVPGTPRSRPLYVYRTHRSVALATAIKKATRVRRAGYLAWIEAVGAWATR